MVALGLASGEKLWEFAASVGGASISAGPAFVGNLVLFGASDGTIWALDLSGKPAWEFLAKGAITIDPAIAEGRIYFGTADRHFYCLRGATGKKIWSRRLQGAPLHPALVLDRGLAVAASNSVLYFLSRRGGSILSWEVVPSRVIYELSAAGRLILLSAASPEILLLDLPTGKRIGQYEASSPLAAGALWVSPFVVLIVEDEESGGQRMVMLRSR